MYPVAVDRSGWRAGSSLWSPSDSMPEPLSAADGENRGAGPGLAWAWSPTGAFPGQPTDRQGTKVEVFPRGPRRTARRTAEARRSEPPAAEHSSSLLATYRRPAASTAVPTCVIHLCGRPRTGESSARCFRSPACQVPHPAVSTATGRITADERVSHRPPGLTRGTAGGWTASPSRPSRERWWGAVWDCPMGCRRVPGAAWSCSTPRPAAAGRVGPGGCPQERACRRAARRSRYVLALLRGGGVRCAVRPGRA